MLVAMELRHLRYFVAVAETLSFTRAATRLRVAQPALSRQIRHLEEELGISLFARDRRSVRLTPVGTAFLEEARTVLAHSEQAVETARSLRDPRKGTLRLGYVWGLFHALVPRAIEGFRRRHPEVAVHLFDFTATQQAEALVDGRLDVGFIGLAREADAAGLARRKVAACDFVVALPDDHSAARRRRVSLADLASEMFLTISETSFPGAAALVSEACRGAGFRPRLVQAAERGHTLLSLVAARCGVALVPESLAAMPHVGVCLRPLTEPTRADLFLAWDPRRPSEIRDAFLAGIVSPRGVPREGPS